MNEYNYIKNLKTKKGVKTSEELFNISKVTDNQCPAIDDIIKSIRYVLGLAHDGMRLDDIDEAIDLFNDIDNELNCLESDLEDIRSDVSSIRDWGEEWKDLSKDSIFRLSKIDKNFEYNYFNIGSE